MKITSITRQTKNPNRLNIFIDGRYLFSLDEYQVVEMGLKKNVDYQEKQINDFIEASTFGKVYSKALEYCLSRPHSHLEMQRYLFRKTIDSIDSKGNRRPGISKDLAKRVLDRLNQKGYLDDEKFAIFWIENRFIKKGISQRRLKLELLSKGVEESVINEVLSKNSRDDKNEIKKIINKKKSKYDDDKLKSYLMRQGFNYEDVCREIESRD